MIWCAQRLHSPSKPLNACLKTMWYNQLDCLPWGGVIDLFERQSTLYHFDTEWCFFPNKFKIAALAFLKWQDFDIKTFECSAWKEPSVGLTRVMNSTEGEGSEGINTEECICLCLLLPFSLTFFTLPIAFSTCIFSICLIYPFPPAIFSPSVLLPPLSSSLILWLPYSKNRLWVSQWKSFIRVLSRMFTIHGFIRLVQLWNKKPQWKRVIENI